MIEGIYCEQLVIRGYTGANKNEISALGFKMD